MSERAPRVARAARRLRNASTGDEGFLLVEVIAALIVFAILATAVLASLNLSLSVSRNDRMRAAAAHLADREIEIARYQFLTNLAAVTDPANQDEINLDPLPGGTAGQPLVVSGVPFTVERTVHVLPQGAAGANPCQGSGAISYLEYQVSANVTWTRMDGVHPVIAETVLTPDNTVVNSAAGFFGVQVNDSTGAPSNTTPVKLTNSAGTWSSAIQMTGSDGCSVFQLPAAGTYSATLQDPLQTTPNQVLTKSLTIAAGQFASVKFSYDYAATITLVPTAPGGYSLPTGVTTMGGSAFNSGVTTPPNMIRPFTSTVLNNLYPFVDGYSAWAGSCVDADPGAEGGTRPANVVLAPGGSATATVPLIGLDVLAKNAAGVVRTNATVVAFHAHDASPNGCLADVTMTLGVTDINGRLKTSLPYGNWTIKIPALTPSSSWPATGALQVGQSPASVTLVTT
jgi:type II secretory pathway pseudopilin PulG